MTWLSLCLILAHLQTAWTCEAYSCEDLQDLQDVRLLQVSQQLVSEAKHKLITASEQTVNDQVPSKRASPAIGVPVVGVVPVLPLVQSNASSVYKAAGPSLAKRSVEEAAMEHFAQFSAGLHDHVWQVLCTLQLSCIAFIISRVDLNEQSEDPCVYKAMPLAILWCMLGIAIILFNKLLLMPEGSGFGFPFPIFLLWWHQLFCSASTNLLRFLKPSLVPGVIQQKVSMYKYFRNVVPLAIVQAAWLAFGNTSYLYLSVAFIQMVKNTSSAYVYILCVLLKLDQATSSTSFAVFLVISGLVMSSWGEVEFTWIGFILIMAATWCDAIRLALTKLLLSSEHSVRLDPMSALYYSSATMMGLLMVYLLMDNFQGVTLAKLWRLKFVLLCNALLAFSLNLTSMIFIKRCGPTAYALTGVLKDVGLILLTCVAFSHPLTWMQLSGCILSLTGFQLYNKVKEDDAYLWKALGWFSTAKCESTAKWDSFESIPVRQPEKLAAKMPQATTGKTEKCTANSPFKLKSMLGKWTSDVESLANEFSSASPFHHVVIPDFFSDELAAQLEQTFPKPHVPTEGRKWWVYNNPMEGKCALDDMNAMPVDFQQVYGMLQSDEFIELMRNITSIDNLENDPHLHGAGLHYYPSGGTLDMHLDYSIHPRSGKERRVNLLIYLNREWSDDYGGDLLFMPAKNDGTMSADSKVNQKVVKPVWNQAVLFQTTEISWHGLPSIISSPLEVGRKSVAIYYVSDPRPDAKHRLKADFQPLPGTTETDGMKTMRKMRPQRRIEAADIEQLTPEWKSPMNEYLKFAISQNPSGLGVCGLPVQ